MTEIIELSQLQGNITEIQKILDTLGISSITPNPIDRLYSLLDTLRSDIIATVEYEYVDATFRDEFYRFYATKFHEYKRNCAKISFFEPGILRPGEEIDYKRANEICQQYLGFVVLRPIDACIGRNVISVKAKKNAFNDIAICKAKVETTAIGLKVSVEGFPHSSQDGEMMACAETSLWSIAEYYGHKYSKYRPISPSEILEAMRPFSFQRQLPSKGLTFDQISIGLKTFGFNPEVYQLYKEDATNPGNLIIDNSMKEVFSCYIESGFPLALCLQGSTIGHAAVCVGRSKNQGTLKSENINGRNIYFSNQSIEEIVVNDDNVACYQKTQISAPTAYYANASWNDVLLTSFMVPLPSKVYMDAYLAINQSKILLGHYAPDGSIARTYLASCRSFRNHLTTSQILSNEDKNILIDIALPRFVWITEFGSHTEYNNNECSGMIVLDATEPADRSSASLILAINNNIGVAYNKIDSRFDNLILPLPFKMEKYNKNIY